MIVINIPYHSILKKFANVILLCFIVICNFTEMQVHQYIQTVEISLYSTLVGLKLAQEKSSVVLLSGKEKFSWLGLLNLMVFGYCILLSSSLRKRYFLLPLLEEYAVLSVDLSTHFWILPLNKPISFICPLASQ